MNRGGRNPFFAAGDHRRAHEMVVDDVGEVIGRKAVGLEDDDVGIVILEFDFAADRVDEFGLALVVAFAAEADDPRGAGFDTLDTLLVGEVAVPGIDAIVAGKDFALFLRLADGV